MKKNVVILLVVVFLCILGVVIYCFRSLQDLDFGVVDVELVDVGLRSATIELKMEVSNPALVPVYITSTSFDIFFDGQFFAHGGTAAVTAKARASTVMTQTITISYADAASAIVRLLVAGGTATVEIRGEAHFCGLSVPFSKTTTVQFKQ